MYARRVREGQTLAPTSKPHEPRGTGDAVFRVDRGESQYLLRHHSLQTAKDAYSHIAAEERAEHVSDILDSGDGVDVE